MATVRVYDVDAVLGAEVERFLLRQVVRVRSEAQRKIRQPGTGRIYKRRSRLHRASAPGQPPAQDLGRLAHSLQVRAGHDERGRYADMYTEYNVAEILENGSRRMAARPFMGPSLNILRMPS